MAVVSLDRPDLVMIPASDACRFKPTLQPSDCTLSNGGAVVFVHGAGYLHNVGQFWSEYPREYMFSTSSFVQGVYGARSRLPRLGRVRTRLRTAIYRHMGSRDLQDQVDESRYLNATYHIDPERIGLYGGSSGGSSRLWPLYGAKHLERGGSEGVTDWAHYNQGYTSNILNLPQNDTLSYRQSSPIYFAEVSKTASEAARDVDTNVHFQDIVRLTERLIELWEDAVEWRHIRGGPRFRETFLVGRRYRRIFELFEDTPQWHFNRYRFHQLNILCNQSPSFAPLSASRITSVISPTAPPRNPGTGG